MLNYESAATSAELYYQANTTYNYKYMNGANSESFAWLFESKESATANDDSQNGMTTIVITKYITPDESIDYENLDPQVRYALWAENDQPLSTEIPLFVPMGGGMKVVEKGGLNLFKWGHKTSTTHIGWRTGDYMLFLPNKGTPKLNWKQNAGALRYEMRKGYPIYDSYRYDNGYQIIDGYNSFINAERYLLESRGWRYNINTGAYYPPSK